MEEQLEMVADRLGSWRRSSREGAAPSLIAWTRARLDEARLDTTIVGHVGDGSYHVRHAIDPAGPNSMSR